MAAKRYFVRTGGQEKGPFTVAQLREAVEQTALSDAVPVRLDGSDSEEPLAALLKRTRKPPAVEPPPSVDGAEEAQQRRIASQWRVVLLVLSVILFALRVIHLASR